MGNPLPTGPGGNTTIVNQDEALILARTVAGVPVVAEGHQEDDSYVTPAFREANVGGA